MATIDKGCDLYAAADYMPAPLSARHEVVFQWAQLLVPMIGATAAVAHTAYYGMARGTLAVALLFSVLTGLGITVGFHRLFTHRSFETVRPIRYLLAVLGSMASQGTLFSWVASHRRHHQFSDEQGDPHSPNLGHGLSRYGALAYSHVGWMLTDHMTADRLRYIPDFFADRLLCHVQRYHLVWVGLGLVLPAALCGAIAGTWQAALGGLLWGGLLRIVVTDHISFAVNSVCHLWGSRPYDSHDQSRNNGIVGFLAFGEGWHNNHHAFPTSARHGLHWWQFDASYLLIKLLEGCGLAWNVHTPTPEQMETRRRTEP